MNNRIGSDFDFAENCNDDNHLQRMSCPWKDIAMAIDVLRSVRKENLIKLYYYKNQIQYDVYFDGWVAAAVKGLEDVPKVQELNTYPDFFELYDLVWISTEDSFNDFHIRTVMDLNAAYKDFKSIENLDFDGVKNFVSTYYKWACEIISQEGGVTVESTKCKIRELLSLQ